MSDSEGSNTPKDDDGPQFLVARSLIEQVHTRLNTLHSMHTLHTASNTMRTTHEVPYHGHITSHYITQSQ